MKAMMMCVVVLAACGGGGGGDNGGPGPDAASSDFRLYSCDLSAKQQQCVEISLVSSASNAGLQQSCQEQGGVYGSGCSHADKIGGCRIIVSGMMETITTWYETGDVAALATMCTQNGGTFVSP